jgi:hypothetical protein
MRLPTVEPAADCRTCAGDLCARRDRPWAPGKLALQYWFFYVYNDWNNLHEADWKMIQLVFDASTPGQALHRAPVEVGYSQHEGAERAAWHDVGPVVGVVLILTTDAPLWLVNVVAGLVYAVTMPFVAITTAYVYFDARVRGEVEGERDVVELPAEIELSS